MKNRYILCLLITLVAVLAAGCKKDQHDIPERETQIVNETTEESLPGGVDVNTLTPGEMNTNSTESTKPTEDKDSDKDKDDDKESTKPTEDKDDNKKPTEATRPGGDAPDSDGPVDPPAPDDPDPTNPGNQEPDPTENPGGSGNVNVPDPEDIDYRTFMDMTPAEQQAFLESFDSIEDFFEWYEAAKKKYEEENPPVDVGDGNVTIPGNP